MTKRILAMILAVCLCGLSLIGCGGSEKNDHTANNNGTNDNTQTPPTVFTPAQEVLDTVVMKVGDIEITYETYRYLYMSCRDTYEKDGVSKTVKQLQDEILDEILYQSAIRTLANQYNANLTNEQSSTVDAAYAELYTAYKDANADLPNALAAQYMTPTVYKALYSFESYLVNNVFNHCKDKQNNVLDFSDEAVTAMFEKYNCTRMIYVGITETRTEAAALNKISGLLDKLNAGEDFKTIAQSYSDVVEEDTAEHGFYFQKGQLEETIENAYYALSEGEYTKEPVKTANGYYLLCRVPSDKDYFLEKLYPAYAFNDILNELEETLTVQYTDFFNTMFDGKDLIPEKAN
jgi:hypothetical protein